MSHANAALLILPNLLTMSRIVVIPLLVALFFVQGDRRAGSRSASSPPPAITDFFDGYVARAASQYSEFGRFLDPLADKLLVAAAILMLVGFDRPHSGPRDPAGA